MPTSFPTLSRAPQMDIKESVEDNAVRDQMENGAVFTRFRYSRSRRTWVVNYKALTIADRGTLRAFRDSVGGAVNFTFTHPIGAESLNVRFSKLPTINESGWINGGKAFNANFELTEL